MAKRTIKAEKPIENMLKAELLVAVNAKIKEVATLKELLAIMAANPAIIVTPNLASTSYTNARWTVYPRGSV